MELTKTEIWFLNRASANTLVSDIYINDDINYGWEFDDSGFLNVKSCEFRLNNRGLVEFPYKFGVIEGSFDCSYNPFTTMEGFPQKIINGWFLNLEGIQLTTLEFLNYCDLEGCKNININNNNLVEYLKIATKKDFKYWDKLNWNRVIKEYPFLINVAKNYLDKERFVDIIKNNQQTKIYLE